MTSRPSARRWPTCNLEAIVEQYARTLSRGGISRGEQADVVSINLRWLPFVISLRQALALEPVRLKLGPTSHEPLAMSPGRLTFFVDKARHYWRVLGHKELGVEEFALPEGAALHGPPDLVELCRSGIASDKPLTLRLQPFLHDLGRTSGSKAADFAGETIVPQVLRPGKYRVRLLAADPTSTAAAQRVFDVELATAIEGKQTPLASQRVDLFQRAGGANRVVELTFPVVLTSTSPLTLTLKPVKGKALLCAVALEPREVEASQGAVGDN